MTLGDTLCQISRELSEALAPLRFAPPVTHVYDPTRYARASHEAYLRRWATHQPALLLVGMNPGPWGMAQTGVPFGAVHLVRGWMGVEAPVHKPHPEHPKRPVEGFACAQREASGERLWGWAKDRFLTPEAFFARAFVVSHCPLSFMEVSGRNRTPDQLPAAEQRALLPPCDRALAQVIEALDPALVVGVGRFAGARVRLLCDGRRPFGEVLHPSPASPQANLGWAPQAEAQLAALGFVVPPPTDTGAPQVTPRA
jgi:single-strand selective monofunctional uracil DNA glycosylase